MKKHFILCILIAVLLTGMQGILLAQLPEQMGYRRIDSPAFYVQAYSFEADTAGKTFLKIGMKVANDELQFSQTADGFQAEFEFSVLVLDMKGNQVDGLIEKKTRKVQTYSETNSIHIFNFLETDFELNPGEYELVLSLTDMDTKRSNQKRVKMTLADYSKPRLAMSSILLADRIHYDAVTPADIIPNVTDDFGPEQDSLFVYFEVYNSLYFDSLQVHYTIENHKKKSIREASFMQPVSQGRTPVIFALTREALNNGKYGLEIEVSYKKIKANEATEFSVNWLQLMPVASDLESAINQIKYIATSGEMRKIRRGKSEAEKQRLFEEFWQEHDPSPGTEKNELFDEYYRRVRYANQTFGKYTEGWKTDMGMVFIRLGPPDEVERHPYEPESKPYQIWLYHRPPYELIFVDHSGFGEYRLTTESIDAINRMIQ